MTADTVGPVWLTAYNSYRVRALARWCALPRTPEALMAVVAGAPGTVHLLGHGNNVILSHDVYDESYSFVSTMRLDGAVAVAGTRLRAAAGARLRDVCRVAARAGLSGLEALWDIPGSIGGAARMNAGAYGVSFYDAVASVEVYFPATGEVRCLSREDCRPRYRYAAFQDIGGVILAVTLSLTPGDPGTILREMGRIGRLRRSRLPYDLPSAGSVFRRPEGAPPVGVIMEEAGLKGFAIGGARISRRHGGFIVNAGGATGADILALVDVMRQAARRLYGVELVLEQEVI